ncbi:hypothetical protein C8N32_11150 [Rhodovulum imhoffii]|uniref:Uncharacterized protein n=1 Tax=Rhodovulum imhoffii TaxID=365340 RepID=A0A2T5BQZ9_9RHOB|nr:hypothetical protein [Rhodovulum imhoffii]MBK5932566.1 hypothetical protein [Rhodovulum imhoffii]PTN01651.1 hypothetical protein C8N32_11150 [Rhodovulum imhoffii]
MKRFALTAAIALTAAAPALAQTQLEKNLGVEPGVYTPNELARMKVAVEQTGNDAMIWLDGAKAAALSTRALINDEAQRILRAERANSDDGIDRLFANTAAFNPVSVPHVNARAEAIATEIADLD